MTEMELTELLTEWAGAVRDNALHESPETTLECSRLRKRIDAELATLRAQLAGVRERVLQLDRYGFGAPDVVLSRVILGDVLAALGGDA